jgi:hypothetical protein
MSAARDTNDPAARDLNLRVVQVRPSGPEQRPSTHNPQHAPGHQLCKARVTGRVEQSWRIELTEDGSAAMARRAVGCLVLPQVGDVALVLFDQAGGDHYLLNVLEREGEGRTLDFPGDAHIQAASGSLGLQARNLDLEGEDTAGLRGRKLSLAAVHGGMRFGRLELLAGSLEAGVRRARAVGERLQCIASHLVSRVGRAVRSTGFELHRAERLRTEVEKSYAVKAKRASILAEDEANIDADRINIG